MTSSSNPENQYLVAYGVQRNLGYFTADAGTGSFSRGDTVAVRSDRGVEEGVVLAVCPPGEYGMLPGLSAGSLLGMAASLLAKPVQISAATSEHLLSQARELAHDLFLPLSIIDIEVLLNPMTAILHVLFFSTFDYLSFLTALTSRWSMKVMIQDHTNPEALAEETKSGCQSCGSGGCGSEKCSTGGCSSGSCGSGAGTAAQFQKQWNEYLAEARQT